MNLYSGGRRILITTDRDTIESELENIEIMLGDVPRDLLAKAPKLAWFQQYGTGVEWLLEHPESAKAPFVLTNCSDDHYAVVADHTFALILSLARGIPQSVRAGDRGKWERSDHLDDKQFFQLRDKTFLIIGLGSIGKEIAKRAAAFGSRVLGVRRDPSKAVPNVERIVGFDQIQEILPEIDIIAASLPHTPATDNLFDATFFAAMKSTSLFFNVGRGNSVNEEALVNALNKGEIAGAGLDVFKQEPLPEDSPLWKAPNLLMTPHLGGCYDRIFDTWTDICLDNLRRYNIGEPLRNVVDKSSGY